MRRLAFILLSLFGLGRVDAVVPGEPLTQALEELRRAGLPLVFSSSTVEASFTVQSDPGPGTLEQVARRILEPYGLGLEQIRANLFSVVRVAPVTAAVPPTELGGPRQAAATQTVAEVDVYASRYAVGQPQQVTPATDSVTRQDLEALPGLFQDAMRAMRFFPGNAVSAISARPHVRGGREDETAIFFDGVPLFEPYHYKDVQALLGTLDPETVSNMNFFSGVFPARYGNRLSGVLDMQPRTWSGHDIYELSQSLLYSEALVVGKLKSAPLQWVGAVRRGAVDLVADLLDRNQVEPSFMDAVGRIQYDLGDTASLAAGYLIVDDDVTANFNSTATVRPSGIVLTSREQADIDYRDGTAWLGWTYKAADAHQLRATISRTERQTHREGSLTRDGSADSSLQDSRHFGTTTARLDGAAKLTGSLRLTAGVEAYDYGAHYDYRSRAIFDPILAAAFKRAVVQELRTQRDINGQSYAAYASVLWALRPDLAIDVGFRWDAQRYGVAYRGNQVSPRISIQYQNDPATVLRASWGRLSQTQRPDELQVTDGDEVFHRAEFAIQTVLSVEHTFADGIRVHAEAFDKRIVDPRPRYANLFDPLALLPELEVDRLLIRAARSRTAGLEGSLRWKVGERWFAWMNYSWSEATDVVDGRTVARAWDQKHAASIGAAWRSSPWLLSAGVNWHSGWHRNRLRVTSYQPPIVELPGLYDRTWRGYFSADVRLGWTHALSKGDLELFGEIDNLTNHGNPCCIDVQSTGRMSRPLLERTASVWMPRFGLVGATWKLP